jgi:hypothetical protein
MQASSNACRRAKRGGKLKLKTTFAPLGKQCHPDSELSDASINLPRQAPALIFRL